ncbi:ribonuclease HII [bacterium]|nr:MAG: ribonuclease HII [bacterium]
MRISPDLSLEMPLWQAGLSRLAGLGEAGRGAWAGPVHPAAVVLPPSGAELLAQLPGVRDSKQMTARQRAFWADKIRATAAAWGVGWASNAEIDRQGILPATRLAMQRAVAQLGPCPQHLLIDALRLPALAIPQTALVRGDQRSLSIAAASVLAKTARDAFMVVLDQEFPAYGFAAHKGYGTQRHRCALEALGPCPQHRFSFAPLRLRRI